MSGFLLLELMNINPETDEVEIEMDGKILKVVKAEKDKDLTKTN